MSSLAARHFAAVGRRRLALVAAAILVLAAFVPLARWERGRQVDEQVRGMERIAELVGPLDSPTLSGYRREATFDCLVYRRGGNRFALELCVDSKGRIVEAIDRRTTTRHIYSLRSDPARSTARVDRHEVDRLLQRMGAA